jgi:beta-lactamase class C
MTIRIVHLFFILAVALMGNLAHAYPLAEAVRKLDLDVQAQLKRGKIPGCAIAIVDKGVVVFIKAYGVRKKGDKAPIDLDTVFQLGSISKPITATLVEILQKQGIINLETQVNAVFPFVNPATKLAHILGHTTGYSSTGWNRKIEDHVPRENLLRELSDSKQSVPGKTFDYHNVAYSLVEDIIATSLQKPFAQVVDEKVFKPFGMNRATVGYQAFAAQQNKAWPHQFNKKNHLQSCAHYSQYYHQSVRSAGGMNASIRDMVAFLAAQIQGIPGIITPEDLAPFHTPLVQAPDAKVWMKGVIQGEFASYYGLGWRIIDTSRDRIVFHGGYLNGFTNFLGFSPQRKVGIVVLHNGESGFAAKTATSFLDMVD